MLCLNTFCFFYITCSYVWQWSAAHDSGSEIIEKGKNSKTVTDYMSEMMSNIYRVSSDSTTNTELYTHTSEFIY